MFQSAPERGLRGINIPSAPGFTSSVSIRPGARAPGNRPRSPTTPSSSGFNPPRSAGSGESVLAVTLPIPALFQSAPERGLRGIGHFQATAGIREVSIRPGARAPGNQESTQREAAGVGVSIRPGARAPGNPGRSLAAPQIDRFQSAPERGLRGIKAAVAPRRPRRCFNPPRSAGSGESAARGRVPTRLGFQSAPERGLRGINARGHCHRRPKSFNPPRSAGSGESPQSVQGGGDRLVSIRPGARAPGNPPLSLPLAAMASFQSAPERGLRGINNCDTSADV